MSKFTLNGEGFIVFPKTEERVKSCRNLLNAEVSFARSMLDKLTHTKRPEYYGELLLRSTKSISEFNGIIHSSLMT